MENNIETQTRTTFQRWAPLRDAILQMENNIETQTQTTFRIWSSLCYRYILKMGNNIETQTQQPSIGGHRYTNRSENGK
jgi:hypothetical protein